MSKVELKDGWFRVRLVNYAPAEDEVDSYEEWVEYHAGEWLIDDLPNHAVVEVLRAE